MQAHAKMTSRSSGARWTGRAISALCVLFLLFDGLTKAFMERHVLHALSQAGYQPGVALPLGITVLICTFLYAIPSTSILGAVLLTGWLGGAVDSMVRMAAPGHPFLFPVIFGVLVWLGLYLRDDRLRQFLPVLARNGDQGLSGSAAADRRAAWATSTDLLAPERFPEQHSV
jgi:hypothetical protein